MKKIVNSLAVRFGADIGSIRLLGGFNSNVFQFTRNQKEYVLKFYEQDNVAEETVQVQVDVLAFIKDAGVNTAEIVSSVAGKRLEVLVENEKAYYALAMSKVGGHTLTDWKNNREWVSGWGQSMGQFHHLMATQQTKVNKVFSNWNEEAFLKDIPTKFDQELVRKWNAFMEQLQQLPKKEEEYGIIHHDLHHENIYLWKKKMYLLDFDDVRCHWYIYDIAIAIYHAMQTVHPNERKETYKKFSSSFFEGYKKEHRLSDQQIDQLPYFLNYREMYSYIYLSLHATGGKELNKALHTMKQRIMKNVPCIPVI